MSVLYRKKVDLASISDNFALVFKVQPSENTILTSSLDSNHFIDLNRILAIGLWAKPTLV